MMAHARTNWIANRENASSIRLDILRDCMVSDCLLFLHARVENSVLFLRNMCSCTSPRVGCAMKSTVQNLRDTLQRRRAIESSSYWSHHRICGAISIEDISHERCYIGTFGMDRHHLPARVQDTQARRQLSEELLVT